MPNEYRSRAQSANQGPNTPFINPIQMADQYRQELINHSKTQQLQAFYQQVSSYIDAPRSFSNESLDALQKTGARLGLKVPMASTDKATAMENLGAGVAGVLDGVLFDLIPDKLYSSRRTELARSIGMWTGILVPAVVAVVGSFGAGAPAVAARLAAVGLPGAKRAAFKLGGEAGIKAVGAFERGSASFLNAVGRMGAPTSTVGKALSWTGPGLAVRGTQRAATGIGQVLSRFGPTAGVGEKILGSSLGRATFKKGAESAMKKAARLAKKGDSAGVDDVLKGLGQEYAPFVDDAVGGLINQGKIGGEAGEILKAATKQFGKGTYAADDLTRIAKEAMGYKKGGAKITETANKFMESLRTGLKNNKSIDDIVKGFPKARQKAIKAAWGNPEKKAEILKLLAENTPEAASSLMTGLGNIALPATIGAWEAGMSKSERAYNGFDL